MKRIIQQEELLTCYQLLSKNVCDNFFIICYADGRIIEANDAAVKEYGYTREELLSLTIFDLIAGDSTDSVYSQMNPANSGGILFEELHRRKDGTTFLVEVSAKRSDLGEEKILLCIIRNISEREQVKQAMQKVQLQQKAILDNIPDMVWLKDSESRFIAVNEAFGTACGIRPDSLVGKTDLDIWPVHLAKKYRVDDLKVMMSRKQHYSQEPLIDSNYHQKWIETIKMPILNDDGEVIGTTGIARDITERKVAEKDLLEIHEKLILSNRELAKVSQFKSEFLANMSHEFKTPLTAILVLAGDLLTKSTGQLTTVQEEYLLDIQNSGKQLLGLIDGLLDLAKTESNKMSLNLSEIQVGELVLDVEKVIHPLARQKDIEIKMTITDTILIIADEEKVRQVLLNLIGNAIKFSPPESIVELTVADAEAADEAEGVLVSVQDYGPGIPVQAQKHIFEAFYQVSQGANKEYPGTGLGLALVKKNVELHTGQIKLVSAEGQGTTFSVFWPAYPSLDSELE